MRHGSRTPDSFEPSEPSTLSGWERRRLDEIERDLADLAEPAPRVRAVRRWCRTVPRWLGRWGAWTAVVVCTLTAIPVALIAGWRLAAFPGALAIGIGLAAAALERYRHRTAGRPRARVPRSFLRPKGSQP